MKYRIVEYSDGHFEVEYKTCIFREKSREYFIGEGIRDYFVTRNFNSRKEAEEFIDFEIEHENILEKKNKIVGKTIYPPN